MLVTIITVNYNNEQGLKRTLRNIRELKGHFCFEYIVIDGDSTDSSKLILKENDDILDIAISEKDSGIYNAMNKGVSFSTGAYVCFLNSGDEIFVNEYHLAISAMETNTYDLIYGDYFIKKDNGAYKWKNNKTENYLWKGFFCHQSMFSRKTVLEKFPFNESLKICADTDFILNILKDKKTLLKINSPFAIIEPGGISDINRIDSLLEQRKITLSKKIKNRIHINIYFFIVLIKNYLVHNILKHVMR